MRWVRATSVALVTAAIGALTTFIAGEAVIRAGELNNYLGLKTERLLFFFVPIGALGAGLIGLLVAVQRAHRLAKTMAIGACAAVALIIAAAGAAYVTADKPPKAGGKPLVLEFEVRVPSTVALPVPLNERAFHPSIFETSDAHWYMHVDFENVVHSGSDTIISGYARLRSSGSMKRSVLIAFGDSAQRWQRIYLPLAGRPTVQEGWSDWISATEDFHGHELPSSEKMALRYRVTVGDVHKLAQDAF